MAGTSLLGRRPVTIINPHLSATTNSHTAKRHNLGEDVSHHNKFLSIPWYRIFRLMMADNDEQCALMPDGTLKEPDKIIWYNDLDDAEPISAPGLGALSHIDSDASTPAGLKGKEPAQRVGSHHIIKPTIKAQQASLTGFFSNRTVLIDGKESVQKSSADLGPSKQGSYSLYMEEPKSALRLLFWRVQTSAPRPLWAVRTLKAAVRNLTTIRTL
ncbi:hypothetical protein H4582DRAFT_2064336 [Lactarius indigo]|nr:hypothetical protein H4582DRAFT_2064336 [Lactarius indigo]